MWICGQAITVTQRNGFHSLADVIGRLWLSIIHLPIILFSYSRRFPASVLRTSSTNYLTDTIQKFHNQGIKNERKYHVINLHPVYRDNHYSRLHLSSQHFRVPRSLWGVVSPPLSYPVLLGRQKQAKWQLNNFLPKYVLLQIWVK